MEARVLSIESNNPEVVVNANDSKSFRKYLREGFYVFERGEGFDKLKKAGILVTIEYNGKQNVVNLKEGLSKYYGRVQDYELIKKFKDDLEQDRVTLKMDSKGYWKIVKK